MMAPRQNAELVAAIQNKQFPIIVCGPSGSGKTTIIESALKSLGLSYRHVDITASKIRRTLFKNQITIAYVYTMLDLERIEYTGNLIIESSIHYLNKLSGYTLIRLSGPISGNCLTKETSKVRKIVGCRKQEQKIDLYRFLGRIFYKKASMCDISFENGYFHCAIPRILKGQRQNEHNMKKNGSELEKKQVKETRASLDHDNLQRDTRNFVISSDEETLNSSRAYVNTRKAPQISDSIDQNFEVIDEISYCSIDDELFSLQSSEETMAAFVEEYHTVSFSAHKVFCYIYENFLNFTNFAADSDSLRTIYDCLSFASMAEENMIALIKVLLTKSQRPSKRVSFKSLCSNYYKMI